MEESLDDGWEPPPLLAEYQDGRLLLQDGNHRFEALVRAGESHAWTLVYFDDRRDLDEFRVDDLVVERSPSMMLTGSTTSPDSGRASPASNRRRRPERRERVVERERRGRGRRRRRSTRRARRASPRWRPR